MNDAGRIADLFAAASDVPEDQRAAFLDRECAGDPDLRSEMDALLAAHQRSQSDAFLQPQSLETAVRQAEQSLRDGLRAGQMFGRYRVEKLIGEGGMSEVYLARDTELDRPVALKLLRGAFRTRELIRRIGVEARILSRLSHQHVARLLDAGTGAEGLPYLVMEYVEGRPIVEYCEACRLPVSARLGLFIAVCEAVQYAHQNLIVHRDLKPSNILVTADVQPKLLDFGIAKLIDPEADGDIPQTLTSFQALTPVYASPEQCRGEPITTSSDVYSLGVILYEMLTGHSPYKTTHSSPLEMMRVVSQEEPVRPSVRRAELRGDLDAIILKALRKRPADRYATVSQLAEDIRLHREGLPVHAHRGNWSYRASKFLNRHKLAVAAAAAVGISLAAGFASTAWQAHIARKRFDQVRELAHSLLFDYHDAIASLPGSTPVRARLVTDALSYLNNMARETGGDIALQMELAGAYLRVGDVQGRPYVPNLGQSEGAMTSYEKARAILEPIVARSPKNRGARRALALACERMGNLELRIHSLDRSLADHRQSLRIREELLSDAPQDPETQRDVAASYVFLGDAVQADCWDRDAQVACLLDALHTQQKGLKLRLELASRHPADPQLRRELAQAYMRVGFRLRDVQTRSGDPALLAQALDAQQQGLRIREELAATDPSNVRDRRDEADQRMVFSDALSALGRLPEAITGFQRAAQAFDSLRAADPSNAESRRDLSFAYYKLATALAASGDLTESWKHLESAAALSARLAADDPKNREDQSQLTAIYWSQSNLAQRLHNYPLALERARAARDCEAQRPSNSGSSQTPLWAWAYRLGTIDVAAANHPDTPPSHRPKYWTDAIGNFEQTIQLFEAEAKKSAVPAYDADYVQEARAQIVHCRQMLAALH